MIVSVANCSVTELMKSLIAVSQTVSSSLALSTFDSGMHSALDMPTARKKGFISYANVKHGIWISGTICVHVWHLNPIKQKYTGNGAQVLAKVD